jgi:hypothetical protein
MHERMAQLGYAHISPPAEAGMRTVEVQAWRLAEERTDALRRYFIGGTEELSDLRALALPDAETTASEPVAEGLAPSVRLAVGVRLAHRQ